MSQTKFRRLLSSIFFQNKMEKMSSSCLFLLPLIPLLFIIYPLMERGILITGDFPYFDTPDYAADRLWLWIEKGSIDGFEFVSRFPIIGLNYFLGTIGISSALTSKAMVILVFAVSSMSFYFSFLLLFKDRLVNSNLPLKLASVLGSLLYAYNVWSFNRIHHWYLWLGYSLLPLFLISILFSFKNPKSWKLLLSSTFLWTIASSTPHMTIFYGIILVTAFLIFIFNSKLKKNKMTIRVIMPLLLIVSSYLVVNSYWIYPYVQSSQTGVLTPNYELTEENLELLSREGSFMNSFRVMAYWLNSDVKITDNLTLHYFSVIFSFVIPIIAFSTIFLPRLKKYSLVFIVCALVGILLAMGTQSPLRYYEILLAFPLLSQFTWVFRDADKWSFLISLAYAFLVSIFSYHVFSFFPKQKNRVQTRLLISVGFSILLIASIAATSLPFYNARMEPLKPVVLPTEFNRLNEYLSTNELDKVYFIPTSDETQWKTNGRVGSIYEVHSDKPSIEGTEYNFQARNYYNFLVNSIMENRSQKISNFIYPLGTEYVIFHNDTWNKKSGSPDARNIDLLNKLYSLDLKNIENIGFYKIFKLGNDDKEHAVNQVNIPPNNIAIVGGLDTLNSLNAIPSFSTLNNSMLFLDDGGVKNPDGISNFDILLLNQPSSYDGLVPLFARDAVTVAPFDYTFDNSPSEVWSKSTAKDLTHAEFHPYLEQLGIRNWDLDFGRGLVITKSLGANLSFPLDLSYQKDYNDKDNTYNLFMRVLKSEKGGIIKIYIDNELIKEIDTFNGISNNLVWERVNSLNLSKGKHVLTLENVAGFNAVNVFAFIPSREMKQIDTNIEKLMKGNIRVAHLFEAERSFQEYKGENTGVYEALTEYQNNATTQHINNSSFSKRVSGQIMVPPNSDLMTIAFLTPKNIESERSLIEDVNIMPVQSKYNIFTSDFERKEMSIPLASMRQLDWINYDEDLVSTSLETNRPIHGNNSLRVDLKQGDKYGWSVLSSDFIPIVDNAYYNASLDISATDVKQLHSRIIYFDSEKKEILTDLVFDRKDGNFEDSIASSILPPKGTKFVKYQILTMSTNPRTSMYILDNVSLDEIILPAIMLDDYIPMKTIYLEPSKIVNFRNSTNNVTTNIYLNNNLRLNDGLPNVNTTSLYNIETKSFQVKGNRIYNYTINAGGEDPTPFYSLISFKKSSEHMQNSTKYGNKAGNDNVLFLNPSFDVHTKMDIIKKSNYTIAMRTNGCETCSALNINIEPISNDCDGCINYPKNESILIAHKGPELSWTVSNNTLEFDKGTYDLRIHSDSNIVLDSVLIYQNDNIKSSVNTNSSDEIGKLFTVISLPANLTGFKKIDPTKYVLDIVNATQPYTISLAEAYDPLWTAYIEDNKVKSNFRTDSQPLYGVVNGFNINKTGSYSLVVEYQPENWFIHGAIISIIGVLLILIISIFYYLKSNR